MSKYSRVTIPLGTACCQFISGPGIAPDSVEYAQQHAEHHLARFPRADHATRQNLQRLVESARKRFEVMS